jgi:hypothetical protein
VRERGRERRWGGAAGLGQAGPLSEEEKGGEGNGPRVDRFGFVFFLFFFSNLFQIFFSNFLNQIFYIFFTTLFITIFRGFSQTFLNNFSNTF